MMSFGAIVGVGWITILGQWLSLAGPGGSVIALLAGAAAMLLVANNYAILATRDKLSAAGEIGAIESLLGPSAAFIVTASLTLATISIVAFEGVSAGWILVTILPSLEGSASYHVMAQEVHSGTVAIAVIGTVIIAALNLRPLKNTARAQSAIVIIKLGVTALFCVAGFIGGEARNLLPLVPHSAGAVHAAGAVHGILELLATMPLWYAGFHVIAILSNERADAVELADVGWVMRASILASCAFYACIVIAAAYVVPWETLIATPLPAAAAFRTGLSSTMFANLVLLSGLLGVCSAWIACFAASVRVLNKLRAQLYGSATSPPQAEVARRARSATIFITVVAATLTLAGRAALVPIVNVAALCFGLVYLLVSIAAGKLAETFGERLTVVLGACVAGSMVGYVIVSAVAARGWMAPEVVVILLASVIGSLIWLMKRKRIIHGR